MKYVVYKFGKVMFHSHVADWETWVKKHVETNPKYRDAELCRVDSLEVAKRMCDMANEDIPTFGRKQ